MRKRTTARVPQFVEQGDAVDWLGGLHADSVDLIVTDPAYESLEKHRKVGTTTRLKRRWFPIFPNARFLPLMVELYRVLKPNRHCYMFCDSETMFHLVPAGTAAGFKFWKPLVWDKVAIGMGYHYRARYEFILFFEKGKRKLNNLGIPDVLVEKRIRSLFPTEKPVPVLTTLIENSSQPGELVIDPFSGSGSTGAAAVQASRRFRGVDIDSDIAREANARIRGSADV